MREFQHRIQVGFQDVKKDGAKRPSSRKQDGVPAWVMGWDGSLLWPCANRRSATPFPAFFTRFTRSPAGL